ncbi:MAG: penicillin-binding protein 2 [Pseudomonadota bacterium]
MLLDSFDALKDLYEEKRSFQRRVIVAILFCLLMVCLLLARLGDLQLLQHEYYSTRADDNRMRVVAMPPVRGLIYDRNGALLAQNRPSFDLEVTRDQVENLDTLLASLGPVMGLTPGDIARFKDRARKTPRYRGVALKTNLTPEDVARFEINRFAFKGVDISAGLTRNYPMGAQASHLVGYVGGISEADYSKLDERQYQGINQIGKLGIEKSHEEQLRGTPGARIVEANAAGRPLRELEQRPGAPGRNLYLTLDAKLQAIAEASLGDLDGAIAAIDPQTGEVLALVSKPGFDPEPFVGGISTKQYRELLNDPGRPLYNRALQGSYPPGSTIKPFMSYAGLHYDEATPDTHAVCSGTFYLPNTSRKYRCHKRTGHGYVDMKSATARSCDVFFYQLALGLGIDRITTALADFGFGKATGIDIPHERNGLLPSREWKRRARKETWFPGETLNIGIGQGYWQVTPLQLAQATARLAMRGEGFEPHMVHAFEDPLTGAITGVTPKALPPFDVGRPKDFDTVIAAMESVMHEPGGTGYRVGRDAPYRIAGKTGTAQVAGLSQTEEGAPTLDSTPRHLRDHAWFMAFAPVDKPRIAIAVLAEHAGHGGSVAAPVARQVMDQYLLGRVLYATETLASTPDEAGTLQGSSEFDGYIAPEERAPPPTITLPAEKPRTAAKPAVAGESPADAVDAPNPEAGFVAPAPTPPPTGDAGERAPPDDEHAEPPTRQNPP